MERRSLVLVVKALGDRMKVFSDALVYRDFSKAEWTHEDYEMPGVDKYLRQFPLSLEILAHIGHIVEMCEFPAWLDDANERLRVKTYLDLRFHEVAEGYLKIKFLVFMQTLRVAVTGKERGVDMYDALLLLGQEKVLSRLKFAIEEFVISPAWQAEERRGIGSPFTVLLEALRAWKGKEMAIPRATSATTATASAPQATQSQVTDQQIRELAYQKWEAAGRPTDDGRQFWEQAQKELSSKK